MKNLKFRVWDKEKKKYVYDFVLAPTAPNWSPFPIERPDGGLDVLLREWDNERGVWGSDYTLTDWANYWFMGVEVEQFTGLQDKFGKDIYEGDIVLAYFNFGPAGDMQREVTVKFGPFGINLDHWIFDNTTNYNGKSLPEIVGNINEGYIMSRKKGL